jgi:hypothetical protein
MVALFWKKNMEKQFESEITPKIRKLEDEGDFVLANELKKIKAQIVYDTAENVKRIFEILDERASQALEVHESEYERVFEPIIEGLVNERKIKELSSFFDNEEKLSVALRIYSRTPIRSINELQEKIRLKEQEGRDYVRHIRQQATPKCSTIKKTLNWFLMGYETLIVERDRTIRPDILKARFLRLNENIRWVTSLLDMHEALKERERNLDQNNKKLLDLLIFTQRYLSENYLKTLTENIRETLPEDYLRELRKKIPAEDTISDIVTQEIEEFLPNLFLSDNMIEEERRFCQRVKRSLAECIYERIRSYSV